MQGALRLGYILAVMALSALTAASPVFAQQPEFCWKDSYGRGVGTVPTTCAAGQDMRGLFCYDSCPAGMKVAAGTVDCHSVCPAGMRDDGLFCRRAEYGRGAGYAWWWRDGFSSSGMISRCEGDNGAGKCEMSGAIAYPKCQAGYGAVGCCICRPGTPDCDALGLGGRLDLSCAKKIQISAPQLGTCPGGERDAGLCYGACQAGYSGVGPVCWKNAPKGWVDCGMGAAKDAKTCASVIFSQVAAVGQLAMTAATLGQSMGASSAANAADKASKLQQLKDLYTRLETAYEVAKKASPALQNAEKVVKAGLVIKKGYTAIDTALNVATAEDLTRVAAQIASIVDSSGVSSAVAAYTYPKCSKYFGN